MGKTPVTLLCGFLGSGKTTLLARMLEHDALSNAVVIINEFGAVSIDHLVVADLAENILELRNGCLCCTIRGDLAMTLRDLYHKRQLEDISSFDHVVIETTGLADPIPLAHTLMANPPIMAAYRLDTIVCVVDAVCGAATLAEHPTAANQVALADIIVFAKTDIASADEIARTRAAVAAINPGAERLDVVAGAVAAQRLFGRGLFDPASRPESVGSWLRSHGGHEHNEHQHDHGSGYTTHVIMHADCLSLAGTSVFLNHAVNEQREQILRIKGIAGFREKDGAPAMLHAVQDKFYPIAWLDRWPSEDHSSRIVFIGRELDTDALDAKFNALCVQAPAQQE